MQPNKTIHSETLVNGMIFDVVRRTVMLPNGKEAKRDIVLHNGAAAMVAVTDAGELVLVRQYRDGPSQWMLELPAGKLDPGEDAAACAVRELEEETGYKAARVRLLMKVYPVGAYCSEVIYLYLCEGLSPGEANTDPDEFLEVLTYPLEDVLRMIEAGEISDMKTVAGVLYYKEFVGRGM